MLLLWWGRAPHTVRSPHGSPFPWPAPAEVSLDATLSGTSPTTILCLRSCHKRNEEPDLCYQGHRSPSCTQPSVIGYFRLCVPAPPEAPGLH